MTNRADEELLVGYVLGQCDKEEAKAVAERLARDSDFALSYQSIKRTFDTISLLPSVEPPAHLVESTLMRVRAMRQTEALVAAPAPMRRRAWAPTFTLRELTALAAIVVVAIGILVPVVSKTRERSQRELCQANQGQIGTALAAFSIENDDFLPAAKTQSHQWLGKTNAASNSSALFQLVAKNLAKPDVFQCPGAGGESFVAQAGMIDFPHPRAISYSYQHSLTSAVRRSDPAVTAAQHDFAIMADATPVFHNGVFDPVCAQGGTSRNHGKGQNVLYLDSTVRWADSCTVGVKNDNIWLVDGVWDYKGDEAPISATDSFLLPNPGQ